MSELSQQTQRLIQRYQLRHQSIQPKEGVATIHVDEVASRVAAFYEKIREVVDWKEEHLMRRAAIIRKLKQRFLELELRNFSVETAKIAESLVSELIRGGHLPNDRIEETKILEVQKIIRKYIFILKNIPEAKKKQRLQFYNWIIEVAACEVEESLYPFIEERSLINYMFELIKERIKLNEGVIKIGGVSEEEKNIQIYITVQRALFKLDHPIISYNLLKYRFPQWNSATPEWLSEIAKNIYAIWKKIEDDLSHPLGKKFYAVCEKYDTTYLLLGDILSEENPEEVAKKITNPEILEGLIKGAYNKRLSTLKKRLFRAAFYSVLSIFLANIFLFLIVEIPLAKLITGKFSPLAITIDILGPTFLMFLLVITIKPPSKSNLIVVIMETMKIVYEREKIDTYQVNPPKRRGLIMKFIVTFIYVLITVFSLWVIFFFTQLAKFPPTSIVIETMGVALIIFAGLAIRARSEELTVEEKSISFPGFLFDILTLPIASLGQWLSNKWKKYNAVAAFFNALIDMPFLVFVEFIEQWRYFLKEKKEEIH